MYMCTCSDGLPKGFPQGLHPASLWFYRGYVYFLAKALIFNLVIVNSIIPKCNLMMKYRSSKFKLRQWNQNLNVQKLVYKSGCMQPAIKSPAGMWCWLAQEILKCCQAVHPWGSLLPIYKWFMITVASMCEHFTIYTYCFHSFENSNEVEPSNLLKVFIWVSSFDQLCKQVGELGDILQTHRHPAISRPYCIVSSPDLIRHV